MSTNFYWNIEKIKETDISKYFFTVLDQDINYYDNKKYDRLPEIEYLEDGVYVEDLYHIGKRSAAGRYCSDCNITPCEGGASGIHCSLFESSDVCPVCGKDISDTYVCSFTWYDYNRDRYLLEHLKDSELKLIKDEYGDEFTVKEFLEEEISNCKIYLFLKAFFS